MAVTVTETAETREGTINALYQGAYRRSFRVRVTGANAWKYGPRSARLATGIPALGSTYNNGLDPLDPYFEQDLGSWVQALSAKLTSASNNPAHANYTVTAEYGPYETAAFGHDPANDWPIKIQFQSASYERVVWIDQTGVAIVNSVGDPFADPCIETDDRPILVVTRAERIDTFDFDLANAYRNSTNDALWNGFAAGVAKCKAITTGDPQYNQPNNYYYYMVQYVFELNRDLWVYRPIDQGYAKLVSGVRRPILDDVTGQTANEPRLLDGSGGVLTTGSSPVALAFQTIPALDFSAFNLDFSAALGR